MKVKRLKLHLKAILFLFVRHGHVDLICSDQSNQRQMWLTFKCIVNQPKKLCIDYNIYSLQIKHKALYIFSFELSIKRVAQHSNGYKALSHPPIPLVQSSSKHPWWLKCQTCAQQTQFLVVPLLSCNLPRKTNESQLVPQ